MNARPGWRLSWFVLGLLWTTSVAAGLLSNLSGDGIEWVESTVDTLPAAPVQDALDGVRLTRSARHRYFVDRRSVTVGGDGVVRFTLSVKPEAGPMQNSYVGLHCRTRRWKTYAVTTSEGIWRMAASPQWQYIQRQSRDSVRSDFYEYFFCAGNSPAGDPPELLRRLAREQGLRAR